MRRGAFTLLEIVIVVAIVAAISAVVLPSIASRVVAAQAGHAVRAIETAVALASGEAMRLGEVVVLVAEKDGEEWVLYAQEHSAEPEARAPAELDGQSGLPLGPPPDADRVELASFSGAELSAALPEVGIDRPGIGRGQDEREPREPAEPPSGPMAPDQPPLSLSLGMFFPDGACRSISPLYVVSADGVRRSVHLRPLTSRVEVRVLPTVEEEIEQIASSDPTDALLPVTAPEGER